ncbi:MAG: membrane dipeptidase [Oscillospiraceae bacterium]|nr:membrane dipeptidase [Oscillospiraceae bacterium]
MSCRVFDAHCDTAFELWYRREHLKKNNCHIDLEKAAAFDAYAQVFAFCSLSGWKDCPVTTQELLTLPLENLRREVTERADRVGFARNTTEVAALNTAGKAAILLSVEGPEVFDCDPARLEALRGEGVVTMTLTWNADNVLAGWHGSGSGLTAAGRDFVREAERCGILMDVSHLSERAFWELAELSSRPILASHSNARAVWDHSRNLTDDQLRAIGQCGGTVGLNLYADFLGENPDFDTLRRHLDHMLELCGEDHVTLGGDLDGCDTLPRGFYDLRDYAGLHGYLLAYGYDAPLLDKLYYSNLMNLLRSGEV